MKRMTLGVVAIVMFSAPLSAQTASDLYQRAVMAERTAGQLDSAIALYQRVILAAGTDRALAARALLAMGRAYETLGRREATASYERVVRDYADQREMAAQARARITALNPSPRSSVLSNSGATYRRVSRDAHDAMFYRSHSFSAGTVAPNGNELTYTDLPTGDLAVYDLATGLSRRLTREDRGRPRGGFVLRSAISPSGLEIAYVLCTPCMGIAQRSELRVIPLGGGQSRLLVTRGERSLELYGWTPDGRGVVAGIKQDSVDHTAIAIIDAMSGAVRELRRVAFLSGLGASASPDGKWIALALPTNEERRRTSTIRVIATDGAREHTLVEHPSANARPVWTPDGRGIVFQSDRGGSASLWFVGVVDGQALGEPTLVRSDLRGEAMLGFARDGRLFFAPNLRYDMIVASLDRDSGAPIARPTSLSNRNIFGGGTTPALSRDGRFLAFVSGTTPGLYTRGTATLVVVDLESDLQRELSVPLIDFAYPRWSADGREILLVGSQNGGVYGFYRVNAGTGAVRALTASRRIRLQAAEWSFDGRSIFYPRFDSVGTRSSLWRYDIDDSSHHAVYEVDSLQSVWSIAPTSDGRWLAFTATYRGQVRTHPLALSLTTLELHALASAPEYYNLSSLTGAGILGLVARARDSTTELWRVPMDGGPSRKLAFELQGLRVGLPTVAAVANRIAFQVFRDDASSSGIWVLENFLSKRGAANNR